MYNGAKDVGGGGGGGGEGGRRDPLSTDEIHNKHVITWFLCNSTNLQML